ncbi:MAG: RNA polymerase sigma factor [Opitutaceae bacterium]|nr:RNA polymerase sigma factor [Opitutaceae bacterium]
MNHVLGITALEFLWRMGVLSDPAAGALPAEEETKWLARGAGGDEQAWQELFEKWKKPLLAFFYRSIGSLAAAEDLTLEVFIRLHRAAPTYQPRAPFAGFVFHIARNLLRNEVRRQRRKPADLLPPEAFDYVSAPDDGEERRRAAELEEMLQLALAQLPEAQRTLVLLVYQQNLDHTTAAEMLGITGNALRVQLHRARQKLKELMQSQP